MFEFSEQILDILFNLPPTTIYVVVGILCWAEAPFFLGFVTPGELAVAAGGALASRGQASMGWLVAAAVMGTFTGNSMGYLLGRRWGDRVLEWRLLQRFLGSSIQRVREFMWRRGEWAIVLGRVTTPTRIMVPFLAGASGLPYGRYIRYDLPTAVLWAAVWSFLGFSLGGSWRALHGVAGAAAFLILGLVITALVIRWVAVRIAANRRRAQVAIRASLGALGVLRLERGLANVSRWFGRRLNPDVAHGLGLTVGFLALIGAVGAIGLVLIQTQRVWGLALIDFPVLEWMSAARTPDAIRISRTFLTAFHWPEIIVLAVPLMVVVALRRRIGTALRVGLGILGAGGGAYFLDRFVLEGVVPHAEYPSVPVAVAAALMAHASASAARRWGWGPSVAVAATTFFFVCTVSLGSLVAGWAAPSGVALGFAIGLGWATTLELPRVVLRTVAPRPGPFEPGNVVEEVAGGEDRDLPGLDDLDDPAEAGPLDDPHHSH